MNRAAIIRRIEACLALAGSPADGEREAAVNRARHLMRRHDVLPSALSAAARQALAADRVTMGFDAASTPDAVAFAIHDSRNLKARTPRDRRR